jgi:hypothetical protein
MRTQRDLMRILIVGVTLAGAAVFAAAQGSAPVTVGANAKKPRAHPVPVVMADSSKWSSTTYQAASSDEHRKMLASGRRTRVTGEVVDVSCYLQLGKHGAAHVDCATKCANNGQPLGILTAAHTLYFLFPEEHHPRRDGQAEIKTTMIPLLGKTVTVSGTATMVRGSHGLFLMSEDLAKVKTSS